jgi:uncharacterized membrane protein
MRFLRTTIVGGIVFLVPIVVLIVVIGKALQVTGAIAAPLAARLPMEAIGAVAVSQLLAVLILVLICFVAGLLARTSVARVLVETLESRFLSRLPPYALLKTKTQSLLSPEDLEGMTPAIVRFDDSWQIAFEIEQVQDDKVALFLPGAPDPWSGSVCVVTKDRVTPLDVSIPVIAKLEKRLGRGMCEAFRDRPRSAAGPVAG